MNDPNEQGQRTSQDSQGAQGSPGSGQTAESPPPGDPPKKRGISPWLWVLLGIILILVIVAVVLLSVNRSDTAAVPDLNGLTLEQARSALEDAKLQLGDVTPSSESEGAAEGTVIDQNPSPGVQVEQGTKVAVVIAGEQEATVPDVVGLSLVDATKTLEDAGYAVKSEQVEREDEAEGVVVEQSPEAGAGAVLGSTVTVFVNVQAQESLVPKVVGLTQEEATSTLEDAGFKAQAEEGYDNAVPEGTVVQQSPEAGTTAEAGATVTILVSQGPNPEVKVPDVVGKTETDAATTLQDAGFSPVPSNAYSASVPAGSVISQNPGAGDTARRGNPVGMAVSLGPEPPSTAVVPDVVGKQEAEAQDLLTQAGYTMVSSTAYSETVPQGQVSLQVPGGGSVTEPGITVAVLISAGPRPPEFVVVPDVRGMSVTEATQALEQVGLGVQSLELFTGLAPEGQVIAQLPWPESSAPANSTVSLFVSKGPQLEAVPQ